MKQSKRKFKTTIRGTIEFDKSTDVIALENSLIGLLRNKPLSDYEIIELSKLFNIISSLTGNSSLNYFLKEYCKAR